MAHPLPPGFRFATPEVLYTDRSFVVAGPEEVALLKRLAPATPRKRCRLCAHPSPEAAQQEMLIVMRGDSYVRPHRHWGKTETLTVLEGEADAVIFDDEGGISQVVRMAAYQTGGHFFYRMPEGTFHGLIFHSDWLVYLETTSGPFDPTRSEGAPWAPAEGAPDAAAFAASLARQVAA